jgi:hypothetical protein
LEGVKLKKKQAFVIKSDNLNMYKQKLGSPKKLNLHHLRTFFLLFAFFLGILTWWNDVILKIKHLTVIFRTFKVFNFHLSYCNQTERDLAKVVLKNRRCICAIRYYVNWISSRLITNNSLTCSYLLARCSWTHILLVHIAISFH